MNRNPILKAILACAALAPLAGAGTIIESAGNSEASVPLGYYAPYGTATVFAVGWTQTSAYTNVDVFANLFSPGSGGGTANYALVTAFGPATSFAQDGIIEGTVNTPANPSDVELFTLPELGPGTYYLVLASNTAAWQYNYPFQSNYTKDSGVTFLGDQQAQFSNIDTNYAPGSSFSGIGYPVEFAVTGTAAAAAAPEPGYEAAIGFALVAFATVLRRVRARKPVS